MGLILQVLEYVGEIREAKAKAENNLEANQTLQAGLALLLPPWIRPSSSVSCPVCNWLTADRSNCGVSGVLLKRIQVSPGLTGDPYGIFPALP